MKHGRYEVGDMFFTASDLRLHLVIRRYFDRENGWAMDMLLSDGTIARGWVAVFFRTDTVIE